MPAPARPFRHTRPRTTTLRTALAASAIFLAALTLTGCGSDDGAGPRLGADDAIPSTAKPDTVLRIGDPITQTALELSGRADDLPFKVEWANISGGPKTLEAFRADALDVGAVADIPPLFAEWTGTDVKIVASRITKDPLEHPTYELGVAPGADVDSLADLKGKRIAYSPGQAQGALVLRILAKAGLSKDDVTLVEIASVDDAYVNALGSKQVDVAPLGQALVPPFLAKYRRDGGHTVAPQIRDDYWTLYTPAEVLQDADKAAALEQYTKIWQTSVTWINEHPKEFAKGFYEEHEGLSAKDATAIQQALGTYEVPATWDQVIDEHQATADLLATEQGRRKLDVGSLYDRRFQPQAGS